jgi:hypothetical protein
MSSNAKGHLENINPSGWKAITPSDTTEYTDVINLYIGTGGDVVVEGYAGEVVTFKNVLDGSFLPCGVVKRVLAATSANDILGAL